MKFPFQLTFKQGRFVCHFPECNMKFYHARKLAVHCSQEHDLTIGMHISAMPDILMTILLYSY